MTTARYDNKKSLRLMQGAVLVETTIVLPFLFLLMLASIEVGRLLYSYNTLSKLTRDSARFLSDRAFDGGFQTIDLNTNKIAEVRNFFVYGNLQGSGPARLDGLNPEHINVTSNGPYVIIEANYPFTTIFGNALTALASGHDLDMNMALHAEVTMRAVN